MKAIVFLCWLTAAIFWGAAPLAAQEKQNNDELEYPPFALDIPEGWFARYSPGAGNAGQELELTSPDRKALFSVKIGFIEAGGWAAMIEHMSVRPEADHGPPNIQDEKSFIVTFNDTKSGATGRKIYRRLDDGRRYFLQTALGFHEELPRLINSVEIMEKPPQKN